MCSVQILVIKTLDQASAQFAASALLTSDQLLALKSKEEGVLGSGVNGVLPSSGEFTEMDQNLSPDRKSTRLNSSHL